MRRKFVGGGGAAVSGRPPYAPLAPFPHVQSHRVRIRSIDIAADPYKVMIQGTNDWILMI